MTLQKTITEDRRLCILRLLAESEGYTINDSILNSALAVYGHNSGRDAVKADLDFLKGAGVELVSVEDIRGVWVATLTRKGLDCAQGRTTVTGVKRPGPLDT